MNRSESNFFGRFYRWLTNNASQDPRTGQFSGQGGSLQDPNEPDEEEEERQALEDRGIKVKATKNITIPRADTTLPRFNKKKVTNDLGMVGDAAASISSPTKTSSGTLGLGGFNPPAFGENKKRTANSRRCEECGEMGDDCECSTENDLGMAGTAATSGIASIKLPTPSTSSDSGLETSPLTGGVSPDGIVNSNRSLRTNGLSICKGCRKLLGNCTCSTTNSGRCPECGGGIDREGECIDCGYIENANPEGHNQYTFGTQAGAKNYGKGLGKAYRQQKMVEKKFPVGSKVRDSQGNEHEVESHTYGGQVNIITKSGLTQIHHPSNLTPVGNAQPRHPKLKTFQGHPHIAAKNGFNKVGGHEQSPRDDPDDDGDTDPAFGQGDRSPETQTQDKGNMMAGRRLIDNDSPPGHLEGADRAQVQAAMAEMGGGSGGGGGTSKSAKEASSHAERTGSKSSHKAAASAHRSAAEYHSGEGNTEIAASHSSSAKSHDSKAGKATRNTFLVNSLIQQGLLDPAEKGNALRVMNAKADSSNADVTSDGEFQTGEGDEDIEKGNEFEQLGVKARKMFTGNVMTERQWIATAPPRVRSVVTNMLRRDHQEKVTLVQQLVSNIGEDDPRRTRLVRNFMSMEADDLRAMVQPTYNEGFDEEPTANYLGNGGGWDGPVQNHQQSDGEVVGNQNVLPLPKMDWGSNKSRQA